MFITLLFLTNTNRSLILAVKCKRAADMKTDNFKGKKQHFLISSVSGRDKKENEQELSISCHNKEPKI